MRAILVTAGILLGLVVSGCSAGVGRHGAHLRLGELMVPAAHAEYYNGDDYWRWHHHHRHCWTECNRYRCWTECD